jgi:hypothetical protein
MTTSHQLRRMPLQEEGGQGSNLVKEKAVRIASWMKEGQESATATVVREAAISRRKTTGLPWFLTPCI